MLFFDLILKESGRNKLLSGEAWPEEGYVLFGGSLEGLCRF